MVFFVCEGCNETLKKNKVDAHAARCRNCWAVSCVDCSVVFEGNDYAAHTSCISEAEKYEGGLYRGKGGKDKKLSPQERWMQVVQSAQAPAGDRHLHGILQRVAAYDNVPRKKAKFVNFMKNSVSSADAATVERVWGVYEAGYKEAESEATASAEPNPAEDSASSGDSKKRASDDASAETSSKKAKKVSDAKPVKWAKVIKKTLKSADDKQLELLELQTRALKYIRERELSNKSDEELAAEFTAAVRAHDGPFSVVEVVRLS